MNKISTEQEKTYFDEQLLLNKKELTDPSARPPQWDNLISDIKFFIDKNDNINTIRDLGCGSGAVYQVVKDGLNGGYYYGYDKSEYAISLAKKNYSEDNFFVFNIDDIDETFMKSDNEILYMCALLDVLPNANEVLKRICSYKFKNVIIHKMNIHKKPSGYIEYLAYGSMPSCSFSHNENDLIDIILKDYDYEIYKNGYNHGYNMRMIRK